MTFLLRAYSDGDGDLTARVRCSAFTHEVKAVDFWRRLGRLLGPFVNSTRSFNPSNQGLFSTPARTDAERLTSKLHRASDSGGMCSRPVKQPSKVCVTVLVGACVVMNQGQAMPIRSGLRRLCSQLCPPFLRNARRPRTLVTTRRARSLGTRRRARRQWRQHRRWHCWRHLTPCWWPRGV